MLIVIRKKDGPKIVSVQHKKVVGFDDQHIPSENDSRFEDV